MWYVVDGRSRSKFIACQVRDVGPGATGFAILGTTSDFRIGLNLRGNVHIHEAFFHEVSQIIFKGRG